jgi:hypothetical protein
MEKKIRSELLKMSAIILVLIGLGIYARDFVIDGIMAKAALNLSIFALAAIAAGIAFRNVLSLGNEAVALKALQVDYGARSRRPADPYARPAIVFREPELLGQGYRMITEELGKQDNFTISSASMQTLLHDVDQRITDRKSTIMYFAGLMVFLGLLGAFMGLMKTVHSVSDLIGSMDMSGNAGPDAFGKMIEGMKAPLTGMSVGFSSSLFGLMTSMVLGALERCMTSAAKTLRNEFEHWLSNMAALEGTQAEAADNSQAVDAMRKVLASGVQQIAQMQSILSGVVTETMETRGQLHALTQSTNGLAQMTSSLAEVVREVADPAPLMQPIAEAVSRLIDGQQRIADHSAVLHEHAVIDREHIRGALASLNTAVSRMAAFDGGALRAQLGELAQSIAAAPPLHQQQQPAEPAKAPGLLAGWFGAGSARHTDRALAAAHMRGLRELTQTLDHRLARIEGANAADTDLLARLTVLSNTQSARLAELQEQLETAASGALATEVPQGARAGLVALLERLGVPMESAAETPPARRNAANTR